MAMSLPFRGRILAPKLVAAIDFGTTFSGYAYQRRGDFEDNPRKVGVFVTIKTSLSNPLVGKLIHTVVVWNQRFMNLDHSFCLKTVSWNKPFVLLHNCTLMLFIFFKDWTCQVESSGRRILKDAIRHLVRQRWEISFLWGGGWAKVRWLDPKWRTLGLVLFPQVQDDAVWKRGM